jgi:orotidine-5'-phosphate decarboxylase
MPPRLAVALDVPDRAAAVAAARTLRGQVDILKVGLELFVSAGPGLVAELVDDDWAVFLDLKLHDIPATVAGAVRAAGRLGVEMLTLHTCGGRRMIEAAAAARGPAGAPLLLGVTVLTSLDDEQMAEVGMPGGAKVGVARLSGLARSSGCDGVVSSPREVEAIKAACGKGFLAVCPGIRPAGTARDDQARVATPADAVRAGADVLVVGRPIMKSSDPAAAAAAIRTQMEEAYDDES